MLIQLYQLLISTNIKSANQMAQYIYAFRHGQDDPLKRKLDNRAICQTDWSGLLVF